MIVSDFNIEQIAESGQCFRWNKISNMNYRGIINGKVTEVNQIGNKVSFSGITEDEFINYFDLERDYSKIKKYYEKDPILKEAIYFGEGIRILNQDKFETLISFIISANNNIPRIKKSVEAISKRYGKHIFDDYYAFPKVEELEKVTVLELKECGVGFRDKYIFDTCKKIIDDFNLDEVSKLSTKECKNKLLTLKGVGPKVADCIMLFSMGKLDAFPVDVWIKRIMEKLYIKEDMSLKGIEKYAKDTFGEYAGVAQQYLFFYARENKM